MHPIVQSVTVSGTHPVWECQACGNTVDAKPAPGYLCGRWDWESEEKVCQSTQWNETKQAFSNTVESTWLNLWEELVKPPGKGWRGLQGKK